MKTKAVRLYGEMDLRLDEFELPEMQDDEIMAEVVTDSLCMSSYKAITQAQKHKKVPDDISENPIILGHEFCGTIKKVGKKWKDQYQEGDKFVIQPNIGDIRGYAPGYSFHHMGGDATTIIFSDQVMENGSLLKYNGDSFFEGSLVEPLSCVVGAFNAQYHMKKMYSYEHVMGIKEGGAIALLGATGPMGFLAIDFAIHGPKKPKTLVVTGRTQKKIDMAARLYTVEEAKKNGVDLVYVNTRDIADVNKELRKYSEKGFDDVFVYVPARPVAELGNKILGYDGCMNLFAGPTDSEFSADVNLYDCHYNATKILGSTGGSIDDMKEAIDRAARKEIKPAVMITHVGGIDSIVDTTMNLPNIPGGKKLSYLHINMPMTAISDLRSLAKDDPFFNELADICDRHNGLWSAEAEKALLTHYGVE